jgi:4-oxalomesaconate hydratase
MPTAPSARTMERPIRSGHALVSDTEQERGDVNGRMLVIGAHSADFVWRAGGAIAVTTSRGGTARVIALSYGERGESGELWKEPGQTVERVKEIRHGEAERAAVALGADFLALDLGDYPLEIDRDALVRIADTIREFEPQVLLTHTDRDPFNPDHAAAFFAVERARALAAGAGVTSVFEIVDPPELLLFEPHQPELCNFTPTTFVDITPVIEQKRAAMAEMKAQAYLQTYYEQRAEQRGNHARRSSGNSAIRYAEAFQRVTPQVVEAL